MSGDGGEGGLFVKPVASVEEELLDNKRRGGVCGGVSHVNEKHLTQLIRAAEDREWGFHSMKSL